MERELGRSHPFAQRKWHIRKRTEVVSVTAFVATDGVFRNAREMPSGRFYVRNGEKPFYRKGL